MKIVVLGAGALGAYFGARWEQAGQSVTFLVREKRAQQLRENGLILHSVEGNYAIKQPHVVTDVSSIDEVDLVLLAVKGPHLANTLDQLKSLVSKGAKVLPVLNGMEHIGILQQHLGEEAVLGGLSRIISTLDKNGDVLHSSPFHILTFGPLHESQQEICKQLESISQNANMTVTLSADILLDMWNKYMFITSFSGITTATNLPIGEVRDQPATFAIAEKLFLEMKKLANAHQIGLTYDHINEGLQTINKLDHATTSSMHQDRRKGLHLEVEHIQGGALRLAEQVSLELPYTETIYGMIKPFEK